jgi:hypothetical protein
VKISIDGRQYEWDGDQMTLGEAFELKELTGWGLRAFYDAYVVDQDPAAYAWIAYCARKRAGEKPEFHTAVTDLAELIESLTVVEETPDPTGPETVSG